MGVNSPIIEAAEASEVDEDECKASHTTTQLCKDPSIEVRCALDEASMSRFLNIP